MVPQPHHDSILAQPVEERCSQMIEIAGFIDADAAHWVADSSVARLLGERPDIG